VTNGYSFLYTTEVAQGVLPSTNLVADVSCPEGFHLATVQEVRGAVVELCANVPTFYILRISGGPNQAFVADRTDGGEGARHADVAAGDFVGCTITQIAPNNPPQPFNGLGGWLCSKRNTP
jgi:hypothetical protein